MCVFPVVLVYIYSTSSVCFCMLACALEADWWLYCCVFIFIHRVQPEHLSRCTCVIDEQLKGLNFDSAVTHSCTPAFRSVAE